MRYQMLIVGLKFFKISGQKLAGIHLYAHSTILAQLKPYGITESLHFQLSKQMACKEATGAMMLG